MSFIIILYTKCFQEWKIRVANYHLITLFCLAIFFLFIGSTSVAVERNEIVVSHEDGTGKTGGNFIAGIILILTASECCMIVFTLSLLGVLLLEENK